MLLLALSACSGQGEGAKSASQLAAKVNSAEISIHQVNFALQNLPDLAPEQLDDTKRRVLDELVDQELAVQQALAAKLDRTPEVLQSLEAARREILARAYLDQAAAGAVGPSAAEIAAYYRQHPELFANRKVYRLQETTLPATPAIVALAREEIARGRTAGDLLAWFRARRTTVSGGVDIKPAEKVDLDILPRLAAMKEGETALFEQDGKALVVTLLAAAADPQPEGEARPLIDQFLRRQRAEAMQKATLQKLRGEARIEYLGEFSPEAEAVRKQQAATAERQQREAAAARADARRAQAAADPRSRAAPPADSVISKGVAGLK